MAAVVAMAALAGNRQPASASAGKDLNTLFQMGKAAYYGGIWNWRTTSEPGGSPGTQHFETRALLAQIKPELKGAGGSP